MLQGTGQFEIVDVRYLANGGFGKVYRAKLVGRHGISVVLKVPYGENPEAFRYAESTMDVESRIQAKMNHPNIVRSLGFFDVSVSCADARELGQSCAHKPVKPGEPAALHKLPVLVLEDAGTSLGEIIASYGGRINQARAVHIAIELLRGLGHLHEEGIVHRDIKPSNALIGRNGEVKIGDLGIAKDKMSELPNTKSNLFKGTVFYMSPEVLCTPPPGEKRPEVDRRADIWAVGVLLYRMLSGHYPFHHERGSGNDVTVHLDWVKRLEKDEITTLPPEMVSPGLFAVIEKFLAKNRDERYADTAQAIEALQPFAFPPNVCAAELAYRARRAIEQGQSQVGAAHHATTRPVDAERSSHEASSGSELVSFIIEKQSPEAKYDSLETTGAAARSDVVDSEVTAKVVAADRPPARRTGWLKASVALGVAAAFAVSGWLVFEPDASAAKSAVAPGEGAAEVVGLKASKGPPSAHLTSQAPGELSTLGGKAPAWGEIAATSKPQPLNGSTGGSPQGRVEGAPPSAEGAGGLGGAPAVTNGDTVPSSREGHSSLLHGEGAVAPASPADEKAARVAVGTLEVVVLPRGSFVSLDGQEPVTAPVTFQKLKAGTHVLRLGLARDALERTEKVKIKPGTNNVRVTLANPFGE